MKRRLAGTSRIAAMREGLKIETHPMPMPSARAEFRVELRGQTSPSRPIDGGYLRFSTGMYPRLVAPV